MNEELNFLYVLQHNCATAFSHWTHLSSTRAAT